MFVSVIVFLQLKKPPKQSVSGSRRADRGVCSPTAVFLLFLLAACVAVIWEKQSELNSAVERSRHLAQQLQDLRDKLKLDGSKSELVSALDKNEKLNQQVLESEKEIEKLKAEIGQLKEKLSLLGTQYNECSGQLTACRQEPLVETMRSKVDRLERQNEQLSRDLGECNGKLLALKTELENCKKSGEGHHPPPPPRHHHPPPPHHHHSHHHHHHHHGHHDGRHHHGHHHCHHH